MNNILLTEVEELFDQIGGCQNAEALEMFKDAALQMQAAGMAEGDILDVLRTTYEATKLEHNI